MESENNYLDGIKLVSFDIWQTLLRSDPAYKDKRAEAIMDSLCVKKLDLEVMHRLIKQADDALDRQTEADGKQYGLDDRIRAIYALLDEEVRIPEMTDEVVRDFDKKSLELLSENLPVLIEPDLLETLAKLKNMGIEMAVISNTGFIEGRHMRVALEKLGVLPFMRVQLFSNEIGVAKPNKMIFEAICSETGYLPEEVLHIGDNYIADYLGALDAGVKAVQLTTDPEITSTKIASLRELIK